ncbi:MAG: hypothetical protein ABW168_26255 [Sedimenticola sp.]
MYKDGKFHLKWYSTTNSNGQHLGREIISNAIENVGPNNIKYIDAKLGRDNLASFESNLANGMNKFDSVATTPLGKAMIDLGYKNIEAADAPYRVIFRR